MITVTRHELPTALPAVTPDDFRIFVDRLVVQEAEASASRAL
jgi:hypothetical protein